MAGTPGSSVADVVREIVAEDAPAELPVADGLAGLGDDRAVRRLARPRRRGEPLGFGLDEVVPLVTPVLWIALDEAVRRGADDVADGLLAWAVRLLRRAFRRPAPRRRRPVKAWLPATPAPKYLPRHARRATRLLGARVTAILLIAAVAAVTPPVVHLYYPGGNSTKAQVTQQVAGPSAPSPALAQLEVYSWVQVGGLDLVNDLSAAENTYYTAASAADKAVSDGQFAAALRKIGASCGDLARVTQRAEAFFPVPDPGGQQIWSRTVTDYQRLTAACRNLIAKQTTANGAAAGKADQQANNAEQAILHWLASVGAITLGSPAPGPS